jgi:sulfatase maturation enzyme AslB (radical SAM superfamily)
MRPLSAAPLTPDDVDSLEVILTAGCNLRCAYCYQNDKKPRRMSWPTLRDALDLVVRSANSRIDVLFLGGEPLLEFPLIRQAVEYVRATQGPDKTVTFSIVTNGTLLGEEEAELLAAHDFDTYLSFDGVPAAQDLRGPRTFPVLDALLDRLACDRPHFLRERLTVGLTLAPATVRHLPESIAYFLRKGVAKIAMSPIVTHDPSWAPEKIAVLEDAFAEVFRICLRHYKRTGEVPLEMFRKSGDGADTDRHRPREGLTCSAPTGRVLAVDVDGQVHGCAVFIESYQGFASPFQRVRVDALRMGDFRAREFPQRLAMYPGAARQTGLFHGKRDKYSSYGRCAECRFLDECSVCPASTGNIPGNTDPRRIADFPCAYNLVALKYREKFPAQPTPLDILTGRVRAYGPMGRVQRRMRAAVRAGGPPA